MRAGDAWEPLLAIADSAGEEWSAKARAAALALSGVADDGEVGRGAQLLGAIRAALGSEHAIPSADLLDKINSDDDLPFGAWRDGRGLDGRGLARLLKPYGVKRATIRFGESTAKGYRREALADAFTRYLPAEAVTTGTSVTAAESVSEKPSNDGLVTAVTDVTANAGTNGGVVTVVPPYEVDESSLACEDGEAAPLCQCADPIVDSGDGRQGCIRCGRWIS